MVKINGSRSPAQAAGTRAKTAKGKAGAFKLRDNKPIGAPLKPGNASSPLLESLKAADGIQEAIDIISGEALAELFQNSSIFKDDAFIDQVKQDIATYLADDPYFSEFISKIK